MAETRDNGYVNDKLLKKKKSDTGLMLLVCRETYVTCLTLVLSD